jgi:DNA excision repair protein ERCC-4
MSQLLAFHKAILEAVHDPATSDLVLLARGLGLRRLVAALLRIYDAPAHLVVLVGARAEDEQALGEELGLQGVRAPGLRVVDYEMGRKERQELYRRGGLVSVTSRILVVDMLQKDIPVELITGLLVLHAERCVQYIPYLWNILN